MLMKSNKVINEITTVLSFKDENFILYNQTQVCTTIEKNTIFFPGIPGLSSQYFSSLINMLGLPTNVWRVDLPGNGGNLNHRFKSFDSWLNLFPEALSRFDRPILVSHSFGGMIPLMIPQMEELVSGIILLNTAPTLTQGINLTEMPLVEGCPFNEKPAKWLGEKLEKADFTATWIPETIPTLILGGENDSTIPFNIFQKDQRFQRPNISVKTIPNSGHFCWDDNPLVVRKLIYAFLSDLFESEGF
jgi:pimeloyl-ACP methyl ester carboxylesterase